MGLELTAYAYFVATVLGYRVLNESQVIQAADGSEPDPLLERLAHARGAFAIPCSLRMDRRQQLSCRHGGDHRPSAGCRAHLYRAPRVQPLRETTLSPTR